MPRRVAGRLLAAAARGVGVVEVGAKRAGLDQRGARARRALAVEGRRGGALGVGAVVCEGEGRRGDLVAEPARERQAAALHGIGAQHPADEAHEARRDGLVEDDRAGAGARLGRAEQRRGALGGLDPDRLGVEAARRPGDPEAQPRLALGVLAGDRLEIGVASSRGVGALEPARRGDRDALLLVGVDGLLDRRDALVGRAAGALDSLGEFDLLLGRPLGERGVVDAGDRRHRRGLQVGWPGELVGIRDSRRLDRAGGDLADPRVAEVRAVCIAGAPVEPRAQPDPARRRLGEALDLAVVDADLDAARVLDERLGIPRPGGQRGVAGPYRDRLDPVRRAHPTAVPPTVSSRIRTWPWPVPTGTRWPSLPQKPVFISKSLASASIAASASMQLPIRVAPRHGRVTLPASIRYPSETPKTKSPVAGSTWPPA